MEENFEHSKPEEVQPEGFRWSMLVLLVGAVGALGALGWFLHPVFSLSAQGRSVPENLQGMWKMEHPSLDFLRYAFFDGSHLYLLGRVSSFSQQEHYLREEFESPARSCTAAELKFQGAVPVVRMGGTDAVIQWKSTQNSEGEADRKLILEIENSLHPLRRVTRNDIISDYSASVGRVVAEAWAEKNEEMARIYCCPGLGSFKSFYPLCSRRRELWPTPKLSTLSN